MKPLKIFFTLTLVVVLFSGCTPSIKQTLLENNTEDRSETEGATNVPQPEEQAIVEGSEIYIGKHLLAGLTYRNSKGEVIKRIQLHGKISRITKAGIFFNRADGKGQFALPSDLESLKPAIPGAEYRLKSTGEVVRNADYISNWIIDMPPDEADE
ncbi:MAG: hypothetical protein OXU23_21740 [Candidatus Poribacteria bacterium]|nr:hypothetical protein [Candidatus Poribacteria bacterium]